MPVSRSTTVNTGSRSEINLPCRRASRRGRMRIAQKPVKAMQLAIALAPETSLRESPGRRYIVAEAKDSDSQRSPRRIILLR